MLELRRLRLLRELHRLGTISAVAEALRYSPSAVSQQLATLEREAGTRLLEPSGRRVRLTPQAELLVEHAEILLAQMERTEAALAATVTSTVGVLRVAAFQSAVLALLPPTLIRLHRQHPSLRVEITQQEPEDALPALIAGDFDIVIGEEYPGHPLPQPIQTDRQDLSRDELYLVIPDIWASGSAADDLAEMATRPFVMEPPGTPARAWATAVCRQAGFEPDVPHNSPDLQTHLRLAQTGLAAALLPGLSSACQASGVLTRCLPGHPTRLLFASMRRGAGDHPTINAFLTAINVRQSTLSAGA